MIPWTRWLVLACLLGLSVRAPEGQRSAEAEFAALQSEIDRLQSALTPGDTSAERQGWMQKRHALELEIAPRFRKLATAQPETSGGKSACIWLVLHGAPEDVRSATAGLLATAELPPQVDDLCYTLATAASQSASEALTRFATELRAGGHQLYARLCLGKNKLLLARLSRVLRDGKEPEETYSPLIEPSTRTWLAASDPAVFERAGVEVLEALAREPTELKKHGRKLTDAAQATLFEWRRLAIGAEVPELEGEDLEGRKLTLSSFKGRIVVLIFWGTYCQLCMESLPRERALQARFKDQPLTLLGVNGDSDRALARAVETRGDITWPSFWDGSDTGPIATRWNVTSWPRTFVIDREGRIRFKDVHGEDLEHAVERLLAEPHAGPSAK